MADTSKMYQWEEVTATKSGVTRKRYSDDGQWGETTYTPYGSSKAAYRRRAEAKLAEQRRILGIMRKRAAELAAKKAAEKAARVAAEARTTLKKPTLKSLPKKNVWVYESTTGRMFVRDKKRGAAGFQPYNLQKGETIKKVTPYSVEYAPGTSQSELDRRIKETHRGFSMSAAIGGPGARAPNEQPRITIPRQTKAPEVPGGTVVAFSEFVAAPDYMGPVVGPGEYDRAGEQLHQKGMQVVEYYPPDTTAGEIPLIQRGAYGVQPVAGPMASAENVIYGMAASDVDGLISPIIGVPSREKRLAAAGIAFGAATAPLNLAMLPFTLPAAAADPGGTLGTMATQFQQRPTFTIGKFVGGYFALKGISAAARMGTGRSLIGKYPKYEVEYAQGIENIVKGTKIMGMRGSVIERAGGSMRIAPGGRFATYSVEQLKVLQRSVPLNLMREGLEFKGGNLFRIAGSYTTERTILHAYKVTKRLKTPPVVEPEISFLNVGTFQAQVGAVAQSGDDVGLAGLYKIQQEIWKPASIKGFKVTKITPVGKGPSNLPYKAPDIIPVSSGASARAALFSKGGPYVEPWANWFDDIRPTVQAGTRISAKPGTRLVSGTRDAAVIGFKEIPEAESYFIPAGAMSGLSPGRQTSQPKLSFAPTLSTRQDRRTGSSFGQTFNLREMSFSRIGVRQRPAFGLKQSPILDMRQTIGSRQQPTFRQRQVTKPRQRDQVRQRQTVRTRPFEDLDMTPALDFKLTPPGEDPRSKRRTGAKGKGRTRQRTRYTPSFAAQLFDIRRARAPRGPFTGVGVRPVVRKQRRGRR